MLIRQVGLDCLQTLANLAEALGVPLVAANAVSFAVTTYLTSSCLIFVVRANQGCCVLVQAEGIMLSLQHGHQQRVARFKWWLCICVGDEGRGADREI